jgi:signal transduction histidine kinase
MDATTLTRVARRCGQALWRAVAGGPDEPPRLLRRAREAVTPVGLVLILVLLVTGWAALVSPFIVEFQVGMGVPRWPVTIVLTAALLVLMTYRPLLAWRLAWLALLFQLLVVPVALGGLPFSPLFIAGTQALVFLIVLFTAAASQSWGVAGWIWLLTGLLAAAVPVTGGIHLRQSFGRSVNGPVRARLGEWYEWGDTGRLALRLLEVLGTVPAGLVTLGVVTVVVVAGQLTRVRSRARRRLAVAEEHGLVLAERARIARELHDVIAHHMSMIAVRAETAPYRLRTVPEAARDEFRQISDESRTALTEMRRLLGVLRSDEPAPPTAPQPGLTDLADLVAAARAAGATVTLEMRGAMAGLPAAVDVSAYRIVQEALTNAARHAPGAPVRIGLRRTSSELTLAVRNQPGPPASPPRGDAAGHGVRGMRERAAALGGELRAGPTEDGGFEVSARIPLAGAVP